MLADYQAVKCTLRKYGLEDSFVHLWHYSRLVNDGIPLPYDYVRGMPAGQVDVHKRLFPHQLELLLRELLLHSNRQGPGERSIGDLNGLAAAVNSLQQYGNAVAGINLERDIQLVLHRVGHQQIPRFSRMSKQRLGRYLSLYRDSDLSRLFQNCFGLSVDDYFTLAFAVLAGFLRNVRLEGSSSYEVIGVGRDASAAFLSRIVGGIGEIRAKLIGEQRLGPEWEYTFNAVHFKPLIALDPRHPTRLYCPIPAVLERRLTEGLFFDLFEQRKRLRGFENVYGAAFESLVGRVLRAPDGGVDVLKPETWSRSGKTFDGFDWMVFDDSAVLFVECKAKRMSYSGKQAPDIESIRVQLAVLAEAIVQNYKNIATWSSSGEADLASGKPCYCVVVTLEDWVLFSNVASDELDMLVKEIASLEGVSLELVDAIPYLIFSIEDLEEAMAAVQVFDLNRVFGRKDMDGSPSKGYLMSTYLRSEFPQQVGLDVAGFAEDFDRLVSGVIAAAKAL